MQTLILISSGVTARRQSSFLPLSAWRYARQTPVTMTASLLGLAVNAQEDIAAAVSPLIFFNPNVYIHKKLHQTAPSDWHWYAVCLIQTRSSTYRKKDVPPAGPHERGPGLTGTRHDGNE